MNSVRAKFCMSRGRRDACRLSVSAQASRDSRKYAANLNLPIHHYITSTVDSTVEQTAASLFPCDHCDYTNVSEKGLRQHKRMKHGKPQLDTQLQSSTPEILRKPTSYSDALAVSPIGDSTRVIPCNNCEEDMSADHICSTRTCGGCDEVFSSGQELMDHERTVHPNMCHVCFKFFVDKNSFLAHFSQEHMNY